MQCRVCKAEYGPEEFRRDKTDGYFDRRCKRCQAERSAKRRKNPSSRLSLAKSIAKRRNIRWDLTLEEYSELLDKPCAYCGFPTNSTGIGLDRINSGYGYSRGNAVPCCKWCNRLKTADLSFEDMRDFIGPAMAQVRKRRIERGTDDHAAKGWGAPRKYL